MSLFTLDWFKSEAEKELEQLKVEEQRLKNQLLQKMIDTPDLFKNYKRDESQNVKAISTSGNISIIMPDKKVSKVEPKEEPKDVAPEKSSTIDEQLPRTIPPQDVELLKDIETTVIEDVTAVEEYIEKIPNNHNADEIFELTPQEESKASLREIIEMVDNLKDVIEKKEEKVVPPAPPVVSTPVTVYKTVKLINNVINVVLRDGTILTKVGVDREFFEKVKSAETEQTIRDLFVPQEQVYQKKHDEIKKEEVKKEIEQTKILLKCVDLLKDHPEFEMRDDSVYLKGINRSIPKLLLERFISLFTKYKGLNVASTDEFLSLKKFWLKCCLNPNAQSAEDLYLFLSKHQFKIDKHGNFYAYRRVVSKNTSKDKDLVDFVSNVHNKVKAVWKKKPAIFDVYSRLGEYKLLTDEKIPKDDNPFWTKVGNLKDLYENLPNMKENSYTDAQTRSFNYRVGEIISMPRNDGDDNNNVSCSKGFHQASKEYDYSGFGDTPILSIINPMDVLAVPKGEIGKLRVCRWFFAMTLPEKEKYILDDDAFDVTDLGDIFEEKCMSNIEEHVTNSYAEEVKRHTFNVPKLFTENMNSVIASLEEMSNTLSKRISIIK